MKIFVCIKQVPDTETKVKVSSDGRSLDTAAVKWIMNPYDEYAVEEAVKLKEANPGAQVHVLTLGPKKRASEVLRTALAMGADEGIVVDAAENLDPLTTAKAIAQVLRKEGSFDLILTGKLAIDDNAACVTQMLGELLGIPHATVVSKLNYQAGSLQIERDVEGGAKELIEIKGAAILGANKGLNTPRYASLPGIMKAKKKVLKEIEWASLDLPTEPKWKINKFSLPPEKPAAKLISGTADQQVQNLVQLLRDEAKVL